MMEHVDESFLPGQANDVSKKIVGSKATPFATWGNKKSFFCRVGEINGSFLVTIVWVCLKHKILTFRLQFL